MKAWLPPEEGSPTGKGATTFMLAEWTVHATPHIINDVDGRSVEEAIAPDAVWADFAAMYRPINATEVLVIVRPPQVDGTFLDREMRRLKIADELRKELVAELMTNDDHLVIPKWEIEVIPEETSGYGIKPDLSTSYKW
jgi:hypothetical protein